MTMIDLHQPNGNLVLLQGGLYYLCRAHIHNRSMITRQASPGGNVFSSMMSEAENNINE